MRLGTTPLREFEYATAQQRDCPVIGCRICRRLVRRAVVRLALSAVAYIVVALVAIVGMAALVWLAWVAFGVYVPGVTPSPSPIPTDIQLPTL